MSNYTEILFHDVEWWLNDYLENELPATEEEHIIYMINDGISSGELIHEDNKTGEEYRGWWQIKGYESQ